MCMFFPLALRALLSARPGQRGDTQETATGELVTDERPHVAGEAAPAQGRYGRFESCWPISKLAIFSNARTSAE